MRLSFGAVLASVVLLSGCGILGPQPSPTSTYLDDSGNSVTVDWVDYPGSAGNDGTALLGYPDQKELEPVARELVERLRVAVSASSGFELRSNDPSHTWFDRDHWHPQYGNGYGGSSMLVTVNCCEFASDGVPAPHTWQSVIDAASEAAHEAGLGAFVIEKIPDYCNADGEQCWQWTATATDGVQWVSLTIEDRSLDPTGSAVKEAKQFDWPLASVGFAYIATVVKAGSAADYARAIAPFIGLPMPEATTS